MSLFIARTSLSNINALGSEAERSYARVVAVISRHLTPEHAAILADPVPVRDGTGIDWYVEDEGEVAPLASLPEGQADKLRGILAEKIQDVCDVADEIERTQSQSQKPIAALLRHAVTFPGEENIWALRNDKGLRPIVVAWGYQPHDMTSATPFNVSTFSRQRRSGNAAGAAVAATGGAAASAEERASVLASGPMIAEERRGGRWLSILASLLMLILFALIVAFLLPACGLRTPFGTIVFGLPDRAECGAEIVSEPRLLASTTADLEREAQVLREELLRRERSCLVEEQSAIPQPEPVMPAFSDVIDDRGEYQVTLMWDTTDDLDLHVVCPSGRTIYHGARQACGGVLDVDANANNDVMDQPVENVTFHPGLDGTGPYQVHVMRYNSRSQAQSVPYRVRVRTPAGTREFEGSVSRINTTEPVTTFSRE